MHFVFRDPCHLLHVPERAFNVTCASGLVPVRGHIEHRCDQGSQLAEDSETTMRPFGKVYGYLRTKQPFDESVEFLTPDQRQSGEALTGGGEKLQETPDGGIAGTGDRRRHGEATTPMARC